jgi:hypothetical protein
MKYWRVWVYRHSMPPGPPTRLGSTCLNQQGYIVHRLCNEPDQGRASKPNLEIGE